MKRTVKAWGVVRDDGRLAWEELAEGDAIMGFKKKKAADDWSLDLPVVTLTITYDDGTKAKGKGR